MVQCVAVRCNILQCRYVSQIHPKKGGGGDQAKLSRVGSSTGETMGRAAGEAPGQLTCVEKKGGGVTRPSVLVLR